MNITPMPGILLSFLLMSFALGTVPVWGQEEELVTNTGDGQQEQAHRKAIAELESSDGPYAEGLSESLLSLALALQTQGRHGEAIELFKRGIHLTRINDGLNCPQQIPLLQGEIASSKATGNYALADARHEYLFRVQAHNLGSGSALAQALMQQASWQYEAYQLGLGTQGYTRLMNMKDLYWQAYQEVATHEGEHSPRLLPPLSGMLQAQYLISRYEWQIGDLPIEGEERIDPALMRFKKFRAESYQEGNDILSAIEGVERERTTQREMTQARNLVMRGDWCLWNGRTEAAWQAYRDAETELAQAGDAQALGRQLFGEPVALPDLAELSLLPSAVAPEQADVQVAFGVSERGRVQDLQRLDDNETDHRQAAALMQQLRKTTFRPRFEAGQPVETENLVKGYSIQ